ncbi:hypothetical protein GLOTRDRAFT_129496 [Gloeophyllum trabeum ATCC 11539]|uniref:Uncharacterized protein n=1 Tax=Gloeophyllum trabeum (strain ATCC 11539 / FP-39264 / Madison 617) TaxID=670483 RepID=S7Q6Q4_GLOTA|nr:uncharacterized protein GLOTRDRAFT_129496 [Gloeophyllum trabeum ATCC 11539]EPQ55207.1 hypothetical protein GLOTRDRAFT_129496 [Gloeophyllum trabeum ATCC 11539]
MRPQVVLSGLLVLLVCVCQQAEALMVMRKESAPMRWDRRWCLWGCRYISVTVPLPSATSTPELAGEATPSVIETPEPSITFESTASAASPLATSAASATETSAPVDAALSISSTDTTSPSAVPSTTNIQSSSSSPMLSLCIPYLAALSAVAATILYL